MEEDDNDFLGGVIEFGDGRQYTIQVSEGTPKKQGAEREPGDSSVDAEGPVSKEERFVDDFDRSWPRSRNDPGAFGPAANNGLDGVGQDSIARSRSSFSETSSTMSGHSPVSTRDSMQSRVLFNERLNRLEPIPAGSRPGPGSHGPSTFRRNGDMPGHMPNSRLERDVPPHALSGHVQVLQKPARDIPPHRRDEPRRSHQTEESRRDGDVLESGSVISQSSADGPQDHYRGRRDRESVNGTSSVASSDDHHSRQSWASRVPQQHRQPHPAANSKDLERQPPPHLNRVLESPPELSSSRDRSARRSESHVPPLSPLDTKGDKLMSFSNGPSVTSDVREPTPSKTEPTEPSANVELLRKAFLAESAERAKKRKQQEEEERLKAQERARKKAAELEAKFAATTPTDESKKSSEPESKPKSTNTALSVPVDTKAQPNKPSEVTYHSFQRP